MKGARVVNTRRMDHDPQDSVLKSLSHVQHILLRSKGKATGVGKFAVNYWLEHTDPEVNSENASTGVF